MLPAMQAVQNQRAHPRFLYRQPVLMHLSDDEVYGETCDLSAGGLFVSLDVELKQHSTVKFSLRFDGANTRAEYLARVVHVRRDADGKPTGAGFELVATTPESRLAWVRHMHWIQEHGAQADDF
mgnify:FL=1